MEGKREGGKGGRKGEIGMGSAKRATYIHAHIHTPGIRRHGKETGNR